MNEMELTKGQKISRTAREKRERREREREQALREREIIRHSMLTVLQSYSATPATKTRAATILLTLDGVDVKDSNT